MIFLCVLVRENSDKKLASSTSAWAIKLLLINAYTSRQNWQSMPNLPMIPFPALRKWWWWNDGTMESNTKSAFAENHLFQTSDNIVQKR